MLIEKVITTAVLFRSVYTEQNSDLKKFINKKEKGEGVAKFAPSPILRTESFVCVYNFPCNICALKFLQRMFCFSLVNLTIKTKF